MATLQELAQRRLGTQDPRGPIGMFSRGSNIYNGAGSAALQGPRPGDPNIGRPLGGGGGYQAGGPGGPNPQPGYSLPFDPAYAAQLRDIAARRAGLTSGYDMAQQRIGQDFSASERDLSEIREQALRRLQETMADRGILRSGINIGEQGEIGREFQGEISNLAQNRRRSLEDLTREFTGQEQGLQSEKEQADYSRIRDLIPQMLEKAQGEARGQAMQEWLRKYGGVANPVTFSPTGKAVRTTPSPVAPKPAPKKKAAIRPTKAAVKRRVASKPAPKPTALNVASGRREGK